MNIALTAWKIKDKDMQVIERPYFKCDFCGKKQFRKSDMTLHEKWCKSNPNNKHICFAYCKHLIKSEENYNEVTSYGDYGDEGFSGFRTIFTCAVLNKKMFSFKAERRKLPVINDKETTRMPLQCDKYEDMGEYY